MNVYVFILFACLIHVCILPKTLANSLPNRDDFEVDIDDDLPEESDEFDMSYLKCTSGGCKLVKGAVKELPKPGPWVVDGEEPHTRTKRRMFFPDNRLRIRAKSAGRYPFNSAVAIRVNGEVKCSGVALFPRFFLTAAHCVQPDGQWKDVEVGVLYSYDVMEWAKVNNTRLHPIWRRGKRTMKNLRLKNYAVLETEQVLPVTPMSIGYVGPDDQGNEVLKENKTYMYLSAFDDDQRPDNLNMRFCKMEVIRTKRIYSKCDTVPQTAGAGVYVRMRSKKTGKVERKVIAIATGDFGVRQDQYSVALRITSRMFPHICYFATNSYNGCG